VGDRGSDRSAIQNPEGSLTPVNSCWTAAPITAEGPRKGEPSSKIVRYSPTAQPAYSVRGSSRRIMFLRLRPAYISVINRRASSSAVIGAAVQPRKLQAHQRESVPPGRSSQLTAHATTVLAGKGALRSLTGPLPAPRRCCHRPTRWAAPAGTPCALARCAKEMT